MTAIAWDQIGERFYETGVDHGVLYRVDAEGKYSNGYAWNGLTSVDESPDGADANPLYADNIKYLNLMSAEEFNCTIEAYTYPDEFAECDGSAEILEGMFAGQQTRKMFGLSYRTKIGNDVDGEDHAYKLHLVYGCRASVSDRSYETINDNPDAIQFSWEVNTTPVELSGYKPTSLLTFDSRKFSSAFMTQLESILYGTATEDPRMPLPNEIVELFQGTPADATLSALTIGAHELSPAFADDVTFYRCTTTLSSDVVTATATANEAVVEILVNGSEHTSGESASWNTGANDVNITVTNGDAEMVYTVLVTKSSE